MIDQCDNTCHVMNSISLVVWYRIGIDITRRGVYARVVAKMSHNEMPLNLRQQTRGAHHEGVSTVAHENCTPASAEAAGYDRGVCEATDETALLIRRLTVALFDRGAFDHDDELSGIIGGIVHAAGFGDADAISDHIVELEGAVEIDREQPMCESRVDYAAMSIEELTDRAQAVGARMDIAEGYSAPLLVWSWDVPADIGVQIDRRSAEIAADLLRRRQAAEMAREAVDAAESLLSTAPQIVDDETPDLATMPVCELLDYGQARGFAPFITVDGVYLVNTPDGEATPLSDVMYRRAAEFRPEVIRRALSDDVIERLRAFKERRQQG
jgi:hypothetical protein